MWRVLLLQGRNVAQNVPHWNVLRFANPILPSRLSSKHMRQISFGKYALPRCLLNVHAVLGLHGWPAMRRGEIFREGSVRGA
jgi:hypothetical protein